MLTLAPCCASTNPWQIPSWLVSSCQFHMLTKLRSLQRQQSRERTSKKFPTTGKRSKKSTAIWLPKFMPSSEKQGGMKDQGSTRVMQHANVIGESLSREQRLWKQLLRRSAHSSQRHAQCNQHQLLLAAQTRCNLQSFSCLSLESAWPARFCHASAQHFSSRSPLWAQQLLVSKCALDTSKAGHREGPGPQQLQMAVVISHDQPHMKLL